jgi:carbamoyltransferase
MRVLGISAFYHDSAAALVRDGEIIAAAQEERFTRKKHDSGFPRNAVAYCLQEAGVDLDRLDSIAFYDKPLLKFERLLDTYLAFAPASSPSAKPFRMAVRSSSSRPADKGARTSWRQQKRCGTYPARHHLSQRKRVLSLSL